jgi:hypothetical protein
MLKNVEDSTLQSDSAQVLAQAEGGPGGRLITRYASRPINIPLPLDVNAPDSWDDVQVKITDVGVGA